MDFSTVALAVSARLLARSECVTETGCWIWLGAEYPQGYGQIEHGGHRYATHRLSYALHKGDVPAGLMVCHKCDTPQCVNPEHLFLGTAGDNVRDMHRKGRAANQYSRAA